MLALVLNFFFPGVGTLVLGQVPTGLIQITLDLIAIPLSFILIGIPLALATWIWGLVIAAQSFSKPYPGTETNSFKR